MEDEANIEFMEFEYNPSQYDNSDSTENKSSEGNMITSNSQQCSSSSQLIAKIKANDWKYVTINPYLNEFNDTLNLFNGLSITNDGVIRFNYNLDQVSFGYWQQQPIQFSELHKLGVVDVAYSRGNKFEKNSFQDALNYLQRVPNLDFKQVSSILNQTEFVIQQLKDYLRMTVSENQKQNKDQEYELYLKHCFNYLEFFNQNNPNQMFYYQILRLNMYEGDSEIAHTGYSKSYLQLLGIDSNSLSQIIMRHKKVDLIREKNDITLQGLKGIMSMPANLPQETFESNIQTFDGFPIKVRFIKKLVVHGFEAIITPLISCQYGFIIVEIDVDIEDLQRLIAYRERIMMNKLNYEDYLKKELSLLYEDVEYSVQSQIFVDKYYQQNIQELKDFQVKKRTQQYKFSYKMITN